MTARFISILFLSATGLACAIGTGTTSFRASAASFDCASATRPMEKLICSDARLSEADERMARAYEAKREALSPAGRQILKQGQRSWLRMVDAACRVPDVSEPDCVLEKYQDRIETLLGGWRQGPFQLVFVERYEAFQIKGDDPDIDGQVVRHEMSYPQVDSPRTPETERWNEFVAEAIQDHVDNFDDEGATDVYFGATIDAASPELISAAIGVDFYAHGAPHGDYYFDQSNVLLRTGKSIGSADLFAETTAWRDALLRRCLPELSARNHELDLDGDDLKDTIDNVTNWKIAPDSLEIRFDFNHIFGWGRGQDSVVIPWRELKPYLRRDLPLALKLD